MRSLAPLAAVLLWAPLARAADVPATPSDYQQKLAGLTPGDTLKLAAGDYADGMNLFDLHGAPGQPIVIEGPANGSPARFLGKAGKNTIDIRDASHLVIKNLLLDGQGIQDIDAIKAGGGATNFAHHITIEGCTITNHDGAETNQQIVAISTKIVTWDWVIRKNVIDGAGTGLYLGNSDGTRAFIGGLIEGNLFRKTLGYNAQIKFQLHRQQADVPEVPTDERVTTIRHNVFIKGDHPSPSGARPNLLVDGFPDSGPGSDDHYEIYGNFFFHNASDALLQVSGRVHVHDNVFVDSDHAAVRFVNHDGKSVIDALVYNNTIYSTAQGIVLSNAPSGTSLIAGNAIFSPSPFGGSVSGQVDNVTGALADAASHVLKPSLVLGEMDFHPLAGSALKGAPIDLSSVSADQDYDRDFNGTQKDFTYRGAYHGEGDNPGWQLADDLKPLGGSAGAGGSGGGAGTAGGSGASGSAGASSGGSSATGGAGASGGSAGASTDSNDDDGCGCRLAASSTPSAAGWALLLAIWAARARRSGRASGRSRR